MKKLYPRLLRNSLFAFFLFFVFTTNAQTWTTQADVPLTLAFPVVVELRGNIHVLSGGASGGASNLHLRYSPITDSWDTLAPVPYLAQQPAGAVVDDKIHICGGGYPNTGSRLDKHYVYDPDSLQWYPAALMPVATAIHKAVGLDGKFYVMTGQPDKTLCEYYDPPTDSWHQLNPLPDQNFWYGAVVATDSTIYRFGGGAYFSPTNAAHRYDKINDQWISIPPLPLALHAPAGAVLNDSIICIGGGYAGGLSKAKVWLYNINSQTYSSSDSFPVARDYHSMVTAAGCVYSVGGDNSAVPAVSTSLLKNCAPPIVGISSAENSSIAKPYLISTDKNGIEIHFLNQHSNSKSGIQLIDITGRIVLEKENSADENIRISKAELIPGIYILLIAVGEKSFVEEIKF